MAKIVNYAYACYFNGIATEEVNLQNTDAINRSWQNLSQAHKWSNLYHALTWKIKSRSFNFDLSIGVADEQAVVEQFEVGGAGKGEFLGNVESFGFSADGIF